MPHQEPGRMLHQDRGQAGVDKGGLLNKIAV